MSKEHAPQTETEKALVTAEQRSLAKHLDLHKLDAATFKAVQESIFPESKPGSVVMAMAYCRQRGLDIFRRPVHIVPMRMKDKNGNWGWRDVVMQGIGEFRTTAARTGVYAGQDPAEFGPETTFHFPLGAEPDKAAMHMVAPEYCTITVYRIVQGKRVAFTHTEYFAEIVATKKDGTPNEMWRRRPRGQLAKCTEAGVLRKAFPEEIGGEYTAEEMHGQTLDTPPALEGEYEVVDKAATIEKALASDNGQPESGEKASDEPEQPEAAEAHAGVTAEELTERCAKVKNQDELEELMDLARELTKKEQAALKPIFEGRQKFLAKQAEGA